MSRKINRVHRTNPHMPEYGWCGAWSVRGVSVTDNENEVDCAVCLRGVADLPRGGRATYTPDVLAAVIEIAKVFDEKDKEYARVKAGIIEKALGISVKICRSCGRISLPRRMWEEIPIGDRPKAFTRYGGRGFCGQHYQKERVRNNETRRKPLSDADVERLRNLNKTAWNSMQAKNGTP